MGKKKGFSKYKICGNIVVIFLENNNGETIGETVVDLKNLNNLIESDFSWHRDCYISNHAPYVTATEYYYENNKKKIRNHSLHGFIMNAERNGKQVDHKNHDTFNNLEENLIVTQKSNNLRNRKGRNSNNTSGYRNVSWIKNCWRVQIQVNGKNTLFSEKFSDIDLAGEFAERMRMEYYGSFKGNGT
jgi:hypothetical protein